MQNNSNSSARFAGIGNTQLSLTCRPPLYMYLGYTKKGERINGLVAVRLVHGGMG
jgi:hypothetical protein